MVLLTSPYSLFSSRPPNFEHFLADSLVALGLPYGPQARERLAQACPDLFGQSCSTLRGYEQWLTRSRTRDTTQAFARFMDARYQRWVCQGV